MVNEGIVFLHSCCEVQIYDALQTSSVLLHVIGRCGKFLQPLEFQNMSDSIQVKVHHIATELTVSFLIQAGVKDFSTHKKERKKKTHFLFIA